MHWLPLVAMVIASALPFPHSPVSRIVEATLDAVTSPDPPAQPPSEHDSKTNSAPGAGDYLTTQNKRVGPSAPLSDSDSARDVSSEAPTAVGELRTSDCDNYNNVSLDNSTMQDYKPDGSISTQGRTNFRDAKDKVHERNDNTALEPRSGVGGGQRELGPTLPWEKPETGRSVGLATVEGRGAGGGVGERLEEILQTEAGVGMDGIQEWDELFLDAHPRVLFAPSALPPEHPPLLLMLESDALPPEDEFREEEQEVDDPLDADGHTEGHGDRAIDRSSPAARGSRRSKRSHLSDARRGELSVCESESAWVRDKKTATDQHGHTVTVLSHIQTQTGRLNQYFYETHCRQPKQQRDAAADQGGPGLAGGGCLGVDKKQWRSECKAKQSFVRALTKDTNERIGWRWIRIDSSCVCVLLSRVNRRWAAKV